MRGIIKRMWSHLWNEGDHSRRSESTRGHLAQYVFAFLECFVKETFEKCRASFDNLISYTNTILMFKLNVKKFKSKKELLFRRGRVNGQAWYKQTSLMILSV